MCHCCDINKNSKLKEKRQFCKIDFWKLFWSSRRDNKMTKYVDCEIMNTMIILKQKRFKNKSRYWFSKIPKCNYFELFNA